MQFNNDRPIDRVFHQIFELIAWEKYDIPGIKALHFIKINFCWNDSNGFIFLDDKVDAMYSAKNKVSKLRSNFPNS